MEMTKKSNFTMGNKSTVSPFWQEPKTEHNSLRDLRIISQYPYNILILSKIALTTLFNVTQKQTNKRQLINQKTGGNVKI